MDISDWVPRRSDFRPNWISPITFRKFVVKTIYILAFGLLIASIVEIFLQIQNINVVFPDEITFPSLLSTIGPVLLSSILAYLYYQQKEILSAEHRSMLSVTRFIGAKDDKIRLRLSNAGSGAAQQVLLRVQLEFDDGRIEGKTSYLGLSEDKNDTYRDFVKPYETVIFSKRVLLPIQFPNEQERRIPPFGMGLRFAKQYGASSGHLKLTLIWEDAVRDDRVVIFDEDFEIEDYEDFSEFIDSYPEKSANLAGGLD